MTNYINELAITKSVESDNYFHGGSEMPAKIEVNEVKFVEDCQIMRWRELCKRYEISKTKAWDLKKKLGLTTGKKEDRKITYEVDGDGCWICTSHKPNEHGYPQGSSKKGRKAIAKVMWSQLNGDWPKRTVMIHSCDNHLCVNPAHISVGTRKDNSEDMAEKDRSCWGFRSGARKLTPKQAKEIYGLKNSGLSQRQVAKLYGVFQATIWHIWNGVTWWRDNSGIENFKVPLSKSLVGKKLNLREVQSILSLKGKLSERKVAKIYCVSQPMIHKIWHSRVKYLKLMVL